MVGSYWGDWGRVVQIWAFPKFTVTPDLGLFPPHLCTKSPLADLPNNNEETSIFLFVWQSEEMLEFPG